MDGVTAFVGLFLTAFLAATVLPAQSELLLTGLHLSGAYDRWALVLVATIGNVLGATVNWGLGRYLIHFQDRRWFPIGPTLVKRAAGWYQRFGFWSLLLAWVPFVGDPLTLVAGVFRVNLGLFLLLVTIGKAARYVALVTMV